jgi:hypothetical protein
MERVYKVRRAGWFGISNWSRYAWICPEILELQKSNYDCGDFWNLEEVNSDN